MQHSLLFQAVRMVATVVMAIVAWTQPTEASDASVLQRFHPQPALGQSSAVSVLNAILVHTAQLLPPADSMRDARQQVRAVLDRLTQLLRTFESGRSDIVKLNVYVRDAAVRLIFAEELRVWCEESPPAVDYVATPLPDPNASIALDAVFVSHQATDGKAVTHNHVAGLGGPARQSHASLLPQRDIVYVSGQAESGTLAEATRATMAGLTRTLKRAGVSQQDIVQIKCFLQPMTDYAIVNEQIAAFFGDARIPPVVLVEWISGSRPIEIELIASAPPVEAKQTVSYGTPPWMKSSTVFSRVARIHGNDRIYVSGLYASEPGNGERQVRSLFEQLDQILGSCGSDLKHLAKATYYVSDGDVSRELNRLRPSSYDTHRPPAASKAMMGDVANAGRSITIDIIAAPAVTVPASADPKVAFSTTVDFGRDLGQSFGSLFEARDSEGRVVAGAGFQDVYNTRFRSGRRTLQFFVRPDGDDHAYTIERLPHPNLGCGIYLCDYDGQTYAWTSIRNNAVRRWDEDAKQWVDDLPPGVGALRSGDGVMKLGSGRLVFSNNSAWYNDRQILSPPEVGGYYSFYYADGHLFFYHGHRADSGSFTRLYACPWTPDEPGSIDLSSAKILKTKYDSETPFAWGQYDDQVLTVSNMGGIYVFEAGGWRTILEADNRRSYQVYSALHWYDRLLLAQYPTGNIFEYRGTEARQLADWPPVLPGVSSSARECQTLSIYGGDLLAGVWPWAELWHFDRHNNQWRSMDRLFSHPQLTDKKTHPYEDDAKRLRLVANHWGQRVTSMVPRGNALILATSSKGTVDWDDRYDFLSDEQRREYGAVLRLRMPGNLATQMKWKTGPTKFDFRMRDGRLSIWQDGKKLASTSLPEDFTVDLSHLDVRWTRGVFGPLRGRLLNGRTDR